MEKNEIAALVQRSQSGDKEAFEALYREFHGKVFFYVRRFTNDAETAADLTSDTFAEAMGTNETTSRRSCTGRGACDVARIEHAEHTLAAFGRQFLGGLIREELVTAKRTGSLVGREALATVGRGDVHVHAQATAVHFQVETFAVHERNGRATVRNARAHLRNLRGERSGRLVGAEKEILLDGLPQNARVLVCGRIVVTDPLLGSELEGFRCRSRQVHAGDTPEGKGLYQLYECFFAVVAREPVQDFRAVEQAHAYAVFRARGRSLNLAVLEPETRAAGLFFKNLDEVSSGATASLKNLYRDRWIHATPRRSSSCAPGFPQQAFRT